MASGPLLSDHLLGILGLVAGGISIFFAVRNDMKMKTAQQAQRRVEQKLLRHMAARRLEGLRDDALTLMARIKRREWADVAESAERLGQLVTEVAGAWSHLLEPLEKDKLDAAAIKFRQFIDSVPTAEPDPPLTEHDTQLMLVRCRRLAEISSEVAGRLSVELMQQPED